MLTNETRCASAICRAETGFARPRILTSRSTSVVVRRMIAPPAAYQVVGAVLLIPYRPEATRYVNAWLQKNPPPRFHLHFTPTSSSWCNLIERWFAELTNKAIRRGVFHSVPDLIDAIENYLANYNQDAEPFIWTTSVDSILDKIARARAALPKPHLTCQIKTETRH